MSGNKGRKPGDEARPGSPQTAENVCPDGNGSGRRDGKACRTCEGTGRIIAVVGDA